MRYLTYDEYSNLGGACDETAFNRNIDRACAMIDVRTQLRLHNPDLFANYDGDMKLVKLLCTDLIDYIATNTVLKTAVTSRSESAGNVSESESYAAKTVEDYASDIDNIFEPLGTIMTINGIRVDYRGANS